MQASADDQVMPVIGKFIKRECRCTEEIHGQAQLRVAKSGNLARHGLTDVFRRPVQRSVRHDQIELRRLPANIQHPGISQGGQISLDLRIGQLHGRID